jgi:methionine synthase II (cobalamin-independent)
VTNITSHIGSLPFLSLNEAIAFNHLFTIPVLSTLPLMNDNEYMLAQVQSGIPNSSLQNYKINLPTQLFLSDYQYPFTLFENFVKQFQNKPMKWQIVGPCTLIKSLQHTISHKTMSYFLDWHLHNIRNFQNVLGKFFLSSYLFLDEPLWDKNFYPDLIQKFYEQLAKLQAEVGVHCCGKVMDDSLLKLPIKAISLDLTLTTNEVLSSILNQKKEFWAGILNTVNLEVNSHPCLLESHKIVLTPACGLALTSKSIVEKVPSILREINLLNRRD